MIDIMNKLYWVYGGVLDILENVVNSNDEIY